MVDGGCGTRSAEACCRSRLWRSADELAVSPVVRNGVAPLTGTQWWKATQKGGCRVSPCDCGPWPGRVRRCGSLCAGQPCGRRRAAVRLGTLERVSGWGWPRPKGTTNEDGHCAPPAVAVRDGRRVPADQLTRTADRSFLHKARSEEAVSRISRCSEGRSTHVARARREQRAGGT